MTALVVPVSRTLPWRVLSAAGAVGLLLAGAQRLAGGEPNPWWALTFLRAAMLAFALGLAFLLDDPARHTTTPVPTPRWTRNALRAALVTPVAALWWTAAVLLIPAEVRPPVGDVTLEAAATFTVALAAAATAVRLTGEPEPGPLVATAVLAGAVLTPLLLPDDWALFVPVLDERWGAAHERWVVVLVGAAVVWGVCGAERVRKGAARLSLSGG